MEFPVKLPVKTPVKITDKIKLQAKRRVAIQMRRPRSG